MTHPFNIGHATYRLIQQLPEATTYDYEGN